MHAYIEEFHENRAIEKSQGVVLFAAHYAVVRELYAAILNLLSLGNCDSSAFALAHPLVEGAYKAQWAAHFAKPTEISRIWRGVPCYPPLTTMVMIVDKMFFTDPLYALIIPYFRTLQTLPHFGSDPVKRHLGDISLRHSFDIQERLQLVKLATLHLAALSVAWYQMSSPQREASDSHQITIYSKLAKIFEPQHSA